MQSQVMSPALSVIRIAITSKVIISIFITSRQNKLERLSLATFLRLLYYLKVRPCPTLDPTALSLMVLIITILNIATVSITISIIMAVRKTALSIATFTITIKMQHL